jgi:hypothetical protein
MSDVARQILEAPEEEVPPEYPTTTTAAAILSMVFPEMVWAVPGLIPVGLTILAGPPKIGKSWLVLALCIAIVWGRKVWGHVEVEPGHVLYLAMEDSERRLQNRLRLLLKDEQQPLPPLDGLHFQIIWNRLDDGGLDELESWLDAHPDCRLVIVDTLAKVKPGTKGRGTAYEEDYNALGALQQMANARGVAVVCIHHLRKATSDDPFEMMSGSTGLTGVADTLMVLKRGRGEAEAELIVTGRDIEEQSLAMKFDPRFGSWQVLGDATEHKQSETRQKILEALRIAGEPLAPKETWESLGGDTSPVSYSAVRVRLPQMADEGTVMKVGNKYKPHNSHNSRNNEVATVTPVTTVTGSDTVTMEF